MAGRVRVAVDFNIKGLRKKFQTMFNDPTALRRMGNCAIQYMEPFVPEDTGQLRNSAKVDWVDPIYHQVGISYSANGPGGANFPDKSGGYAGYVYNKEVYRTNIQSTARATRGMWFSVPGVTKTPTGREMEYHNSEPLPAGVHHWNEVITRNGPLFEDFSKDVKKILVERWHEING